MRPDQATQIVDQWLRRSTFDPDTRRAMMDSRRHELKLLLTDVVPDLDAWVVVRADNATDAVAGAEPQILALTSSHLYRIHAADVDGNHAFGFGGRRLDQTSVSVAEWLRREHGAEFRHRLWVIDAGANQIPLRTEETLNTDSGADALELFMRELLSRADRPIAAS